MGANVQSITPLMDRTYTEMDIVKGRLHILTMTTLLCKGSFNHPVRNPWAILLDRVTRLEILLLDYNMHGAI